MVVSLNISLCKSETLCIYCVCALCNERPIPIQFLHYNDHFKSLKPLFILNVIFHTKEPETCRNVDEATPPYPSVMSRYQYILSNHFAEYNQLHQIFKCNCYCNDLLKVSKDFLSCKIRVRKKKKNSLLSSVSVCYLLSHFIYFTIHRR